jgi:hypothetical protein
MTQGKKTKDKAYTKPSRFNLVISFEQYKVLMERKREARENHDRVRYKDLEKEWGIKQHHMASAVHRGIKEYDHRIEAESGSRRYIPTRIVERRVERRPLGIWPESAVASRTILTEHTESGVVRRGYSPFVRASYFEE